MLDPMPNGGYNEGNLKNYPSMIRGFVIKAYSLLPTSYDGTEYAYLECATDNAVARDQSHAMRRLATGSLSPGDDPFAAWWGRDYEGIYYVNRFLENDLGLNTRFYVNAEIDQAARKLYQGEAYALRAWFQYDLLRKFGGPAPTESCSDFRSSPRRTSAATWCATPTTAASRRFSPTATRRWSTCRRRTATCSSRIRP